MFSAYTAGYTAGGSNSASAVEATSGQAGAVRELSTGGTVAAGHSSAGPSRHQPAH